MEDNLELESGTKQPNCPSDTGVYAYVQWDFLDHVGIQPLPQSPTKGFATQCFPTV